MTVEELLKQAGAELQEYGYTHGMREADIFLSHILKLDSGTLFSKYEDPVDETAIEAI